MKIIFVILFTAFIFVQVNAELTNDEAEKIILDTQPLKFGPLIEMTDEKENIELFHKQMDALSRLKTGEKFINNEELANQLIAFLHYTTLSKLMSAPMPNLPRAACEDAWPAFSIILSIPGSEKALERYCLNNLNPINYRAAAFVVLRYKNQELFQRVATKYKEEFRNADPQIADYIKGVIENEKEFAFWGVPLLDFKSTSTIVP